MSINNTYTEEFDWFNMSPHHVEATTTERSIKIINDYIKTDFSYPMEEGSSTVDSAPGDACQAYKNWKNINLGLGPLCGFENPVIVGQVRQSINDAKPPDGIDNDPHTPATSWFQGVNSGNFKSDGLMVAPYRGHQNEQADIKTHYAGGKTYGWNQYAENRGGSWEQSDSRVIQFHVPGGLKANTWMPLFSWQPFQIDAASWGNGFHWLRDQTDGVNYWEFYADQAVNGKLFPQRSPHHLIKGLRTASHEDTVWNQYDVDPSLKFQSDNGNVSQTYRPSGSNNHRSSYHSSRSPVVWWYAHDGNNNAMIVSIQQQWNNDHSEAGYGYNGCWGLADQPNPELSGCYIHKPPQILQDIASQTDGIAQFQEWANAQNTSWVYKDATSLLRSWGDYAYGIYRAGTTWNLKGQVTISTARHLPEIIHGLTPFGDNANLANPQNFYLHRYGSQYQVSQGRPMTSYKFGNLVKTNNRNAWFNGQGRGGNSANGKWGYNPEYAPNIGASLSLNIIAAHEVVLQNDTTGPVRVNFVTTGGQFDPVPVREDQAEMFYEFPGKGVSYGAIDKQYSTPQDPNSAWTNVEALVDPTNTNEAICKASGADNAVYVPLVGMTEGNSPDSDDKVATISLTLGGTRKMVLGPQVLKATIVDESNGAIPTVPTKTIPGQGSDTLNDDITVVWDGVNVLYDEIRTAKLKIWVHTPG